jgi:hypothetical protein
MTWLQEQKKQLYPFVGKKTGKSTSKFVKRRITVGGTPLNTKEKKY